MPKPLIALLTLSLLAVACDEPRYQSRTMSSYIRALEAPEDFKRRQACEAMTHFGPQAAKAIPKLVAALEDPNPGVQAFCADALAAMGPAAKQPLEEALSNLSPDTQLRAAVALLQLDPAHEGAGHTLVQAVTGVGDTDRAKLAQTAIVRLGTRATTLLIPHLKDNFAPVRVQVLQTLSKLADKGNAATPAVAELLKDPKQEVRVQAIRTYATIGKPDEVTDALKALTKDETELVADTAGVMLQRIGARDSATGNQTEEEAAAAAAAAEAKAEPAPNSASQ